MGSRFLDPLQAKIGTLGSTPLHIAAEEDAAGVVRELMLHGADANLEDDQGDTPVNVAVLYGSPRALEELINQGADLLHENNSGECALHQLVEYGMGDDDMDLSEVFAKRHFSKAIRAQQLLVDRLREKGQLQQALSIKSKIDGNSPLHTAVL